jgi:hypothetical protein
MNKQPSLERRRGQRSAFSTEFKGTQHSPAGVTDTSSEMFQGWIQNFSKGGLGLIANRKLNRFDVIRGEVMLPDIAMAVPTLVQVRWVKRAAKGSQYHVGLQFLI